MPKNINSNLRHLHTNRAFQVINALGKDERKRLALFLNSPYFNKSRTLVAFFEVFIKISTANYGSGFDKVDVWNEVFSNEVYDDVSFRKYCSDLLKLIEKFLSIQSSEFKNVKVDIDLLEEVVRKKIKPLYNSVINDIKSSIEKNEELSSEHYFQNYKFESLLNKIKAHENLYKNKVNFSEISQNLDNFYFIEKIKLLCSAISHQRLVNVRYDIEFGEEINNFLSNKDLSSVPSIKLFLFIYRIISNDNDIESFYGLKDAMFKHWKKIPISDLTDIVVNAMNFCTSKINKGNSEFLSEYFDLIEFSIKNKVFVNAGEFGTWRFNNFAITAIRLGKFDWAEKFIQDYKQYLNEEERQNVVAFNFARLYYNQKKYSEVLNTIQGVEYSELIINLNSKSLLLTSYYELGEYDALDSFMESFRVYLNRHKDISLQRRKSFLNCIKFTRRLIRITPGDKTALEKLRQDLLKEKSTTVNFEWLMEKITELE